MENIADSNSDLKLDHEHDIGPEMQGALRLPITMLLKAAKDIQFYPENSPIIDKSIDHVIETFQKVCTAQETLVFEVRQRQFLVYGTPLLDSDGPERDFAEQLFGLGIRIIEFIDVPTRDEIRSFITATLYAHRLELGFEQLNGQLENQSVSSIRLLPSGNLSTMELVDISDEGHADEKGLWTGGDGNDEPAQLDRAAKLLDEYDKILHSQKDGAQKALDHVKKTDCLVTVARTLRGHAENNDAKPVCDQFYYLLVETSEVVQNERPSLRQDMLDEVSKAIESMDTAMHTTFVQGHLMQKAGSRPSAVALLNRLSDDALADLLADSLVVHGGAEAAIQTYFMTVPVPAERQTGILVSACKKAKHARPDDSAIQSLLVRKTKTTPSSENEQTATATFSDETFEPIDPSLLDTLEIHPDEMADVQTSVQTALDSSPRDNAATLMGLLGNLAEPEHLSNVLDTLNTLRIRLLSSPDGLAQATDIVEALLKKTQASSQPQQPDELTKMLNTTIKKACAKPSIHALLDLAVQCEKSDKNYETILRYLRLLEVPAYIALIDSLRTEESRSRRMAARKLVVSLGEVCVDVLARDIGKEDWFVVRNVVSILGDIQSDKGLKYLAQALIHADERVRKETVTTLGKIGTEQAAHTLIDALKPDDLETAHAAVRWLGLIADKDSIIHLTHLMDKLGNSPKARQVKLSIVDSLTQIGSPKALECLEHVKNKRKFIFFKKDPVLSAAATRAIATIEAGGGGKEMTHNK